METNKIKLTSEQTKSLIDFIVEYVDKNPHKLPGYKQIFEAKNAEFTELEIKQEQVTDFYKSESYKNIREIKDRFNKKAIQNGFGSFSNFYDWYMNQLNIQQNSCYYCQSSKEQLEKAFRSKGESKAEQKKKPLYSTKAAFSSSFQIDKKNPNKGYNKENCVLACAFCNNAKSDMVKNAELFKKFLGPCISSFCAYVTGDYISVEIDE